MILLALIFLALCGLVCGLLTASKRVFVLRVVLIVCAPAVAFAVWQAAQPPTGWPAHARTPAQAQFQWAVVREPDQLSGDPGEIDLWVTPPGAVRPRAYRMPYTRQLHKQAAAATQAVKGGVPVGMRVSNRRAHTRTRIVFYRLPPPAAPIKR